MNNSYESMEFYQLIIGAIDRKLSDHGYERLEEILNSDPRAIDAYVDLVMTYSSLCMPSGVMNSGLSVFPAHLDSDWVWQALALNEKTAEGLQIEKHSPTDNADLDSLSKRKGEVIKIRRQVSKLSLFTAITSVAALLIIMAYVVSHPRVPQKPVVATLSNIVDARWADQNLMVKKGDDLRAGPMRLLTGFAQIAFDDGADVIIQAPADFELESASQIFLQSGKMTAKVPPPAVGFVVRTPKVSVVDYGTEFGVLVDSGGKVETQVFKGQVELRTGANPVLFSQARKISAGQKCLVDVQGNLKVEQVQPGMETFVRNMPAGAGFAIPGRRINLADIVGGGNGFDTGKLDYVINVDTGKVSQRRYDGLNNKTGPGVPIVVDSLPYVNCLFVPDPARGLVKVSTEGNVFRNCPDTNGTSWSDVANGGIVQHQPERQNPLILNGSRYGTAAQPAIYMHANLGITFDLEAIRASLPGAKVVRFTALCGISENVFSDPTFGGIVPKADFWVLVDGNVCYSRIGDFPRSGAAGICVELTGRDRFLSLVVTDSDRNSGFDWGVFALPAIELE